MRLSLRFLVPLIVVLGLFAYAAVSLSESLTIRWFERDLDSRSALIATTVREPLTGLLRAGDHPGILRLFTTITQDERLYAMAYCPAGAGDAIATATAPSEVHCARLESLGGPAQRLLDGPNGPLFVSVVPFAVDGQASASLVFYHNMNFIAQRSEETRKYLFYFFIGLSAAVSLITVVIAQVSWRGWVQGLRALLQGEGLWRPSDRPESAELRPIAHDLRALIRDIEAEHRSRDQDRLTWTPEALRSVLHTELRGQEIVVVSNREPYIHEHAGGRIVTRRPASGLVTALEPIMRACSGTWIAHGGGSADRDVVDRHDRIGVPAAHPAYQLRRVWLSPEEEAGYYYGFANEGLWPLCHIAHVRPVFRTEDWDHYVTVNRRFAEAVVAESRSADPIVLVQDYHFALVPRMIRQALPEATVITFWHIPWPNPEAFGICPWREEILDGLLGSSILGFHTQFHCNNFVDTVDRLLEARADRETFTVSYQGSPTAVRRYPISVAWPTPADLVAEPVEECRRRVRARHGLPDGHMIGVGVDRLDYTKGIEERLRTVERLLERRPEWVGRFTFIQLAAPSRAQIPRYQQYGAQVAEMAAQINARFPGGAHPAIILKVEHHEPPDVYEYYRAADVCFVSSLHDGMNLVAKEFIASRDDEQGVLILSQFTGAARELPEAIIVNPYDTDQCADALHAALTMPASEQRERIRLMRGLVRDFNVFRWAGRMLIEAAHMRRSDHLRRRSGTAGRRRAAADPEPVR